MKKSIILGALVLTGLAFSSCDDFLDDNRYPLTSETNTPEYWNNEDNVKLQCDQMLQYFTGYSSDSSYGEFYFNTLGDDQCGSGFVDWKYTSIPTSSSSYTSPYNNIRHSVMILDGLKGSTLDPAVKANYEGIARLGRAYQQYYLVRRYGDCNFIETALNVSDQDILYGPRQKRDVVFDKIVEDLEFACNNISTNKNAQYWSRDLAYAMLSYMTLCEGTYRKYCTEAENGLAPDPARAEMLLKKSAAASDYLINSGRYSLSEKYRANYQSFYTEASAVPAMVDNPEMILFRAYAADVLENCVQDFTCGSTPINGITKDAFDAYLFRDGKPLGLTKLKTDDAGTLDADGNLSIAAVLAERDDRLAQTTDPFVYYTGATWSREGAMQMTSSTGYGVSKYDNTALAPDKRITTDNTVCAPIYWYSVILLENAEAKAELQDLGKYTMTDADLDKTINQLFDRAILPRQTVASLSNMNDPAKDSDVSSLIWEIRRCRRCELIMDYDFRYWDLIRWHKLHYADPATNPDILLGANIMNATVKVETTNNYIKGNINYPSRTRDFKPQYYSYPIPSDQLNLNPALGQNKGWVD